MTLRNKDTKIKPKINATISINNNELIKEIAKRQKENGESFSSVLDACIDLSVGYVEEWLIFNKKRKKELLEEFKQKQEENSQE